MDAGNHVNSLVILICGFVIIRASTDDYGLPEVVESAERRLINALLARYKKLDKVARPVTDASDTITVEFGIRLVHLDLDETEQLMKTSCWVRMVWFDKYLEWESQEHGGITGITIPADRIWTPEISLVNTGETEVKENAADLSVKYTGKVTWAVQRKFSSACLIDVTEYPYDRHICDMWFQSISSPSWSLNLTASEKSPLDLDTYLSSYRFSQEWDIVSNTSERLDKPRDVGQILMYSRRLALRFTLTVQRRPGFKAMLLMIPCTLLSFLFPIMFCFPVERPDRHTLAMSVFSSLTIMLFMVNETAPPSAAFVPRLTLYYCFNMLVLLVAISCSAVVVNLSKRGQTRDKVPTWVKQVFIKGFGKVLCLGNRIEHLSQVKRASRKIRQRKSQRERNQQEDANREYSDVMDQLVPSTSRVPETFPTQVTNSLERPNSIEHPVLVVMNRKLSRIESKIHKNADESNEMPDVTAPVDVRLEWRILSLVLDRLFFFIFLVMDCISLAVFHPRYVQ